MFEKKINSISNNEKKKIKKFFGHSFEIDQINNNDMIPVGGSIFLNDVDTKVMVDVENDDIVSFMDNVEQLSKKYNSKEIASYLWEKFNIDIDTEKFIKILAFTARYNHDYPADKIDKEKRREFYDKNNVPKLSEIIISNSAECAEISILAQVYLQENNIKSNFFSGDLLTSEGTEFSEKHSFLIIEINQKKYIYDPSNPIGFGGALLPNLRISENDFESEIEKYNTKKFIETFSIYNKAGGRYYGVNDGTNINWDTDIVHLNKKDIKNN